MLLQSGVKMRCSYIIYSPHGSGKSAWCGILNRLAQENLLSVRFDPSVAREKQSTSVCVYDTDFLSGNVFDQYVACRNYIVGNVDILLTNSINLFLNLMSYFDRAFFVKPLPSEVFVGAQNRYLSSTGEAFTGRLATNIYLVSLKLLTSGIKERLVPARVQLFNDLESAITSILPAAVKSRCFEEEFRQGFENPRIQKAKLLASSSGYLSRQYVLSAIDTVSKQMSGFPYRENIFKRVPLYAKALTPIVVDDLLPKKVVDAVLGEGILSYLSCASASIALTSRYDGGYYPWMEMKLSELNMI